jgi:hypothetical protein
MWPSRSARVQQIEAALQHHAANTQPLPGITPQGSVTALALQIVASLRREDYYHAVQQKPVSAQRADPNHPSFDAERAVAFYVQQGMVDEAAWLIFLMTHFAKPAGSGWRRLQDVYGQLGAGTWTWALVSANPAAFTAWLTANWKQVRGKFGNHRKYESLDPARGRTTTRVVADYLALVGQNGHQAFWASVTQNSNDPFDRLYRQMKVFTFGRLAKFDYLMLIARYGLVNMAPTSAYLQGATGPREGAALLFDGNRKSGAAASKLHRKLDLLDQDLGVGMAVLEDAICNWQKSPRKFVHFKG